MRIVLARVPQLPEALAEELVRIVGVLRRIELRKAPSVSETIDWGRTLLALGLDTLDDDTVRATLGVVLKHHSDALRAASELMLNCPRPRSRGRPAACRRTSSTSSARCGGRASRSVPGSRWTPPR